MQYLDFQERSESNIDLKEYNHGGNLIIKLFYGNFHVHIPYLLTQFLNPVSNVI